LSDFVEGVSIFRVSPVNLNLSTVKLQFLINLLILNNEIKNQKTILRLLQDAYFNIIVYNDSNKNKNIRLRLQDIIAIELGTDSSAFRLASLKSELLPWRCFTLVDSIFNTYDFVTKSDDEWDSIVITIFYVLECKNKKLDENKEKDKSVLVSTETISSLNLTTDANAESESEKHKLVKKIQARVNWKKAFIKYKYHKRKNYFLK